MARYIGSVCKLCRREGTKLFLKAERCYTDKCGITRRSYPPGQHGQARIKHSEYSLQLREKQKIKPGMARSYANPDPEKFSLPRRQRLLLLSWQTVDILDHAAQAVAEKIALARLQIGR